MSCIWTKIQIQISFVVSFMSSLLIPPFQIACTYVSLSNIRVNAFGFHVACDHCSPICSSTTPAILLQNLARTYMKTPFLYSILAIRKQKDFEQFFLGLDYSCKYTHNKMNNQESEDVLYWRQEYWIAMQRWEMSSWVFCITLKIIAFGNTEESTFEL